MHRRLVLYAICLVILLCAAPGCATIMHGRTQTISITSDPPGATARVGPSTIVTPGQVTLDTNKSYTVTFEMPGYAMSSAVISKKASGWLWGNILIGGIPGLIIDLASGSANRLRPEVVHARLQPLSSSALPDTQHHTCAPRSLQPPDEERRTTMAGCHAFACESMPWDSKGSSACFSSGKTRHPEQTSSNTRRGFLYIPLGKRSAVGERLEARLARPRVCTPPRGSSRLANPRSGESSRTPTRALLCSRAGDQGNT
ncbi:MAG: PEGA domain-containing protein [Anaerolineaceae bacterium]|nr:PEGA domain-containing protein [Anaerolineaceae bacterium]